MPAAEITAPAPTVAAETSTIPKIKPRKRAADFLGDDEGGGNGVASKEPSQHETSDANKSKKKRQRKPKSKADVNGDATETAASPEETSEKAAVEDTKKSSDAPAEVKRKTDKAPEHGSTTDDKKPTSQAPKKKGRSTVDVHAEKIKKLLGQKDDLSKLSKKDRKQSTAPTASLAANSVNGVSSNNVDESLEVAAKDIASTSMQAEAQRTTERELEDEYGTDEDDDQAGALLQGFDSDTDDPAQDIGFDKDKPTAPVPNYKKTQKKLKQAAHRGNKDGPGAVYVGRIPHGFYENEMRQYFSQFGIISKLRLSRNRKTGHSKHFAFLEFESDQVAKIVAETMDNYLMFGHILKCKYIEADKLHPDTWKGANKRFRVAPHNRMEKRALEAPKTESQWTTKNAKEQRKREKKAEKLKAMGYDIELPKLKDPKEVLERKEAEAAGKEPDTEVVKENDKDVPAPAAVPKDDVSKKKAKKEKKEKREQKTGAAEPSADSTTKLADSTKPKIAPEEKAEKKKDKAKSKKAKKEAKQSDAPPAAAKTTEQTNDDANGRPAEAGAQAGKPPKQKKKKAKAEAAQNVTDVITPVPSAEPEVPAVEAEIVPPASANGEAKMQNKTRKSGDAGNLPASLKVEKALKKQKVDGEVASKKKAKKT
jgi:nucleolar protein 15